MERAVQKTDDDAATSKYSAVLKGYYEDEYIKYFCNQQPAPRLPLINKGTYCRVFGIDKLVAGFLERTESCPQRAIVSLGAGSDTRPFHLLPQHKNLSIYELDFPVKTRKKELVISRNPPLRSIISEAADRYHLVGIDLRKLSRSPTIFGDEENADSTCSSLFNLKGVPTLLLSECCLCYLEPVDADGVLKFFAKLVPPPLLSIAIYEPISLNDEFGRVMAENLAMRGLSLPTINLYSTTEQQIRRLKEQVGVNNAGAVDILTVYTDWISQSELERISRLELLDEVEEMYMLMQHYCIAWGFTSPM